MDTTKRTSMKRRRPCASSRTMIAAALLTGSASVFRVDALAIFPGGRAQDPFPEVLPFQKAEVPVETNVTPTPTNSGYPTAAPITKPPLIVQDVMVLKQALPVNFDMVLNVTDTVDLNGLLTDLDGVLEDYLLENLLALEGDDLNIRDVGLDLTFRRRLLRMLRQSVSVAIEGSIRYDMDSTGSVEAVDQSLNDELDTLLLAENVDQAVLEIDGVLGVLNSTIIKDEEQTSDVASRDVTGLQKPVATNEDLERPSTLSIIFGFILTGIAAVGLVVYAWIYYRKRQKRLRRQKQMKESIQYRMPSSPSKPLPPPPQASATTPSNDDSSEGSSYKGIDSASEEGPADSFAKELQMAASLDQQAWEDFQTKKQTLDKSSPDVQPDAVVARSDAHADEISGSRWAKSFPYGDEAAEEGVEWSPEMDNVDDWEPYSGKTEEKKDEWGGSETFAATTSSAVALQSIERTLSQYGSNPDAEPEDTAASSDIVMEVERLSKFVKRYAKRKERRQKRETDRVHRSFDSANNDTSNEHGDPVGLRRSALQPQDHHDPTGLRGSMLLHRQEQAENISYLNNMRDVPSSFGGQKRNSASYIDPTGTITSYTGTYDQDPPLDPLSNDILSVGDTDDFSEEDTQQESSLLSGQRLGITPFSVQKPEDRSFEDSMSPMMQKLAKAEAMRSTSREDFSLPTDEQVIDRRRAQSDGDYYHNRSMLSDLRNNNAIIDSSKSDVNVAWGGDGPRSQNSRIPHLQTPRSAPREGTNRRFNKLRNLFEERPNNAIFPPDQHWQYGVANANSANM